MALNRSCGIRIAAGWWESADRLQSAPAVAPHGHLLAIQLCLMCW